MKMTKIAFWRKVKENCDNEFNGCYRIECKMCKVKKHSKECHILYGCEHTAEALAYAEKQIKRHEQKCKKSIVPKYTADVQPDTTGSVLKKIVMKPANTDPTPLEIAKAIRDNGYDCVELIDKKTIDENHCPLKNKFCGSGSRHSSYEQKTLRKQLIDSYIAEHDTIKEKKLCVYHNEHGGCDATDYHRDSCDERCKKPADQTKPEPACEHLVGDLCGNAFEPCDRECPANTEVPQPIKFDDPVPEYVYKVSDSSIKIRKVLRFRLIDEKEADGTRKTLEHIQTNNGDYDFENCYKTLDEAVAVAKAKWGIK